MVGAWGFWGLFVFGGYPGDVGCVDCVDVHGSVLVCYVAVHGFWFVRCFVGILGFCSGIVWFLWLCWFLWLVWCCICCMLVGSGCRGLFLWGSSRVVLCLCRFGSCMLGLVVFGCRLGSRRCRCGI